MSKIEAPTQTSTATPATNEPISVLIVASKDDVQEGWARAETLFRELEARKVRVQLINKLGFELDELHLVARYRVVSTPTILILKGNTVLSRLLGIHSALGVHTLVTAQSAQSA